MTQTAKSRFWNMPAAFTSIAVASMFVVVGCNKTTDPEPADLRTQLIAEGKVIFEESCTSCHGHNGEGESGPPLLHSDYLIEQRMRPARILLLGLPNPIDTNPIMVNGILHENTMFDIAIQNGMDDRQIAAVLTYVRAVLNDSTSVNCVAGENEDGQPISECDIVPSPEDATTTITPEEIGALRDSLTNAGLINP
jgi:mono/diheme cytochrome c family protein